MRTPKKPGKPTTTTTTPKQPPSSSNKKEKDKNRVVVARPPKSPAPPASSAKSRDSDSESVLSQTSSASSQRAALPIFIQKQLAQDIEAAGGIKHFKNENSFQLVSALCNENEDIYGRRGNSIRTKITKKVLAWKRFDEEAYACKVLNRFQVKSAAILHFELQNTNAVKYNKKVSLQQLSDDDSSFDSDDDDNSVASSESIPRRILFSSETMQAPPPSQNAATPMGSVEIMVDVNRPELNREVLVFQIKDIPGVDGKSHYDGFEILHQLDVRWVLDDLQVEMYKARIFSSNSVLLQVPAWSYYSVLANRDEFDAVVTSNLTNAMDDVRHDFFANREAQRFKQILLTFPKGYVLSAKEINDESGEDQELEILPIKYSKNPGKNDKKETHSEHWAGFKVARIDIKAHKRGKVEVPQKKSKAAALLLGEDSGMQS
jgi:hypothetical protein